MTPNPNDADVLRRYLLGSVDEESREAVERRLFSDDEIFWDRLCLAEEELVDDYVRGDLDDEAAASVERHFLCTAERRDKVAFARALKDHLERRQSIRQGFWQRLRAPVAAPAWAMAVAATLLLVLPGVTWQLAGLRVQPLEISVVLSPGTLRGVDGRLERLSIPTGCTLVRVQLDLGIDEHDVYQATLYEVSTNDIWSQKGLAPTTAGGRRIVTLTLPAELLPPADYHVELTGSSKDAAPTFVEGYDFRVIRP